MPTGYTAAVVDGKVTDFSTFALTCARAFGALIDLKEEPMSTPIPEEILPSTKYYDDRIAEDMKRLSEVQLMSAAEVTAAAKEEYEAALARHKQYLLDRAKEAERLTLMGAKVKAWVPPTSDHFELKNFMLQQLEVSMPGEWTPEVPQLLTAGEWQASAIKRLTHSIKYSTEERGKEIARAASRNDWLKNLRASLVGTPK